MIDGEPAGLARRFAARLLDCLIGAIAWSLGAMWLVIVAWGFRRSPPELEDVALLAVAILALGLALHVAYHVAFIGGCGQTPGKMALGIAVVNRSGRPAGYGRAAGRCLGGALSVLTLGLGAILVLFSRERRGLADLVAGTRVVRQPRRS